MSRGSARALLLAALHRPGDAARLDLGAWDSVLREARAANLVARLAVALEAAGMLAEVPSQVRPHLVAALRLSEHQHDALRWECRHLDDAMRQVDSPVLLLKGAAYVMSGLAASRGRLFGDIDLLVDQAALAQAEAGLMLTGWTTGELDPYDDRYYRRWMHEIPPMVHRLRGTMVDLHHNILPRTARHVPDAHQLLSNSRPAHGTTLHVPAPADLVIHSAVHLFHEGESVHALRDLMDLKLLLDDFTAADPGFWQQLASRAEALGLVWPVHLALRYLRRVLDVQVPPAIEQGLAKAAGWTSWRLRWLDAIYLSAFLADASSPASLSLSAARLVLYVRGHVLRMPAHLLAWHLGRKAVLRLFKNTSRS